MDQASARAPPDFRTISKFRRRHMTAPASLFVQVLKLAEKVGLMKLGHVALDGTKIKANASKHKAMSYERMKKRDTELPAASRVPRLYGRHRCRLPGPRASRHPRQSQFAAYNETAEPFAWTKKRVHQRRFKTRRIAQL